MAEMEKEMMSAAEPKQNLESGEMLPAIDKAAERSYGKANFHSKQVVLWLMILNSSPQDGLLLTPILVVDVLLQLGRSIQSRQRENRRHGQGPQFQRQ